MTLSDRVSNLRARKQAEDSHPARPVISGDASGRPALRLIPGSAQVADPQPTPADDHPPLVHGEAIAEALEGHTATATHPPTVAAAASGIWPARDDVRHGLVGQVGSAAAGLAQTAGLVLCWGAAHVFFGTKTAAAISFLVLLTVLTAIAIASHA
jgi:hypothetical protein